MATIKNIETLAVKSAYELERNKPKPSKNHAIVQTNIIVQFAMKYPKKYRAISEISVEIARKESVPDIGIFNTLNFTPGKDEIRVKEVPIGVIEILSPKQNLSELVTKSIKYFEAGVKSYWLVLPDLRSIYVFDQFDVYEVFSKKQKLIDKQLGIGLSLKYIFK